MSTQTVVKIEKEILTISHQVKVVSQEVGEDHQLGPFNKITLNVIIEILHGDVDYSRRKHIV